MRYKTDFSELGLNRDDAGGISLQGILVLVVIVGIVWGGVSMFPVLNTPSDLENAVKESADDWLRLLPREQTQQARRLATEKIKGIIATQLEGHTWDRKALEIIVDNDSVVVRLPYTINIDLFGIKLTFDKKLDVYQQAISF